MSNNIKISTSTNEESNYIRNQLIEFNSKHTFNGRYEEFNICLKDDEDRIIAGLNSAVIWNWMEIDILWVDESMRNKRYGTKLLEEAEKMAKNKECTFIKLNTFSFQAPNFYEKHGYSVIAVIEDAPVGCKHYYYKKDLN